MFKTPIGRIIADVVVFVAVLVLPWWLSSILLVMLIAYFPLYIEALFFAFLFDTLYASGRVPLGLIIAAGLLLLVMFIKTRIRR